VAHGWSSCSCSHGGATIPAPLTKKGKWGAKAPRKIGAAQAPCSASVRGHG
jgi:hypothetical protein